MAKNLVIIEGEVLENPPLRNTKRGVQVTNFMLLVNDPEPNASLSVWITAFGRNAVNCSQSFSRGSRVQIKGKLSTRQRNREMEIVANEVVAIA